MDPNVVLEQLRALIIQVQNAPPTSYWRESLVDETLDTFETLDTWLSSGGFVPTAWKGAPSGKME